MRMLPPRADRLSSCPPELAMSEGINIAEAYDKGRALFMEIELLVAPGALVPRPETELLGASALDSLRRLNVSAPRVIDMCWGAGTPACAISLNTPRHPQFASRRPS
jgi:release factor glutamine methyltransferase